MSYTPGRKWQTWDLKSDSRTCVLREEDIRADPLRRSVCLGEMCQVDRGEGHVRQMEEQELRHVGAQWVLQRDFKESEICWERSREKRKMQLNFLNGAKL